MHRVSNIAYLAHLKANSKANSKRINDKYNPRYENCFLQNILLINFALLFASLSLFGCGSTCKKIKRDRTEFLERAESKTQNHIIVSIPFKIANKFINTSTKDTKPVSIKIPGLGKLGNYFKQLKIKLSNISLTPASKDHIGFLIKFDVLEGDKAVFDMAVKVEVKPNINAKKGKLQIEITPDVFKSVKPVLGKKAKKKLGAIIYKQIPRAVRFLMPKSAVETSAANVISFLASNFYDLFKGNLLKKVSSMGRVEFNIPNVPIKQFSLLSSDNLGGYLQIVVKTGLPVQDELVVDVSKLQKNEITMQMSGGTVAEMGNWAIKEGRVPDRYTMKGKPSKDGKLQPGFKWIAGNRPMKIDMWKVEKPCMCIHLGATPQLNIEKEKVELVVNDGKIEKVDGSPFTKAAVLFAAIWKDAFKISKNTASKMEFSVAGNPLKIIVTSGNVKDNQLVLGMHIEFATK